ncbi:hypothetical protein [Rikenella microfusus]|uniref:hypothetical protein n=1 Tax=Rikenella microfusus TaxID=28139 RepID=UPI00055BD614|nr:hypothetical protein [Rikenella microfusus]
MDKAYFVPSLRKKNQTANLGHHFKAGRARHVGLCPHDAAIDRQSPVRIVKHKGEICGFVLFYRPGGFQQIPDGYSVGKRRREPTGKDEQIK